MKFININTILKSKKKNKIKSTLNNMKIKTTLNNITKINNIYINLKNWNSISKSAKVYMKKYK